MYFVLRHKKQAIQVFTIESFINTHHFDTENQKKGLIETINDFFEGYHNDGNIEDLNNGDGNGGGDEGGE